ncbi:MAG: prolyl oligopeptidase family serine peptidase [Anaerolineae bacterium]|nr:prolyl oligopeptidase family serine peptidase [Anaerolineae bacterium]
MRRKWLLAVIVVIVVLVFGGGYLAAGAVVYNTLTRVNPDCNNRSDDLDNAPDAFDLPNDGDASAYLMPDYETVSIPSRDAGITISAWYVPAAETPESAPAVLLVHGLNSCKQAPSVLLPGGMLHHAGFNVLMMDMRDHGASTVEDGRYAVGTEEYRDVLGAWDWLIAEQGIPAERIGLFGVSLGAATMLIATGAEPQVAAVWEDSGFADIQVALDAELARNGYPQFLAPAGLFMGRLMSGDNVTAISPLQAVQSIGTRPLFITHGTADRRLSVQYAYDLAAAANAVGNPVEPWIIDGADHVQGMFMITDDYAARLVAFFTEHLGA